MKIKLITAFVAVFSVFMFGYSSGLTKAEASARAFENRKCAVPPFERAFGAADSVFIGEVKSERKDGNQRIFEFEVEKYWKGEEGREITIEVYETARYQAWFKEGGKYLIYASRDKDGNLRVGRCSRSRDADSASEDLQKLGEGKRPD